VVTRQLPRKVGRATGRTYWGGRESILETRTCTRHPLKVWRDHLAAPTRPHRPGGKIIGKKKDDIGVSSTSVLSAKQGMSSSQSDKFTACHSVNPPDCVVTDVRPPPVSEWTAQLSFKYLLLDTTFSLLAKSLRVIIAVCYLGWKKGPRPAVAALGNKGVRG